MRHIPPYVNHRPWCRAREANADFEMRCYRRLLHISYSKEVHRTIQAAFGEYDELPTLIKKWKLRCFGHVSRSQGRVNGKEEEVDRRRGGKKI